uniref:Putative secreted protein n=1 Tax=Anopheles darlingi TaxID=43151 RepID=A0A2M4DCQ7_ANODA
MLSEPIWRIPLLLLLLRQKVFLCAAILYRIIRLKINVKRYLIALNVMCTGGTMDELERNATISLRALCVNTHYKMSFAHPDGWKDAHAESNEGRPISFSF